MVTLMYLYHFSGENKRRVTKKKKTNYDANDKRLKSFKRPIIGVRTNSNVIQGQVCVCLCVCSFFILKTWFFVGKENLLNAMATQNVVNEKNSHTRNCDISWGLNSCMKFTRFKLHTDARAKTGGYVYETPAT